MNYQNGKKICIGDTVKIGSDLEGTVVCVIDSGEYSEDFPKSEWDYLKVGFLVYSPETGLVHYSKMSPEIKLMNRSTN